MEIMFENVYTIIFIRVYSICIIKKMLLVLYVLFLQYICCLIRQLEVHSGESEKYTNYLTKIVQTLVQTCRRYL